MKGSVGVVGAGTMGAGIAQVAAVSGHRVLIADAVPGAAGRAVDAVRERVRAQVARGRLTVDPDALALLSLPHREVVALHFLEQMPLDEIGEVTGTPVGTVKSRLHYAKCALKSLLETGEDGHESR